MMKAKSIAQPICGLTGEGVVHSVFQRSCNLLIGEKLIGIVANSLGNNPYSLVVSDDFFAQDLEPGMAVKIEEKQVRIGSELVIRIDQAKIWNPELHFKISEAHQIYLKLEELLQKQKTQKSLLRIVRNKSGEFLFDDEYEQKIALKYLRFLKLFFAQEQNQQKLLEAASNLVGLGIGLTPSGDDFLAGIVGAFHCFAQPTRLDFVLCNAIATSKTTAISNAILSAALRGWFCEKISELLLSLQSRRSDNNLLQNKLENVYEIGHSSGSDTLAGIYVALRNISLMTDAAPQNRASG